ncbi:MAG: cupin domain-containing protein [Sphingobium sp.]
MEADDEAGARTVIDALGLRPHPEGGWYRESWRAPVADGGRAAGTSILFLLEAGQRSHWHRVDATEHWFWHAGAPLTLSIATDKAVTADVLMGPDVLAGQHPQALVPEGQWQAAASQGGWTLVSCVVIPGFEFSGFTLARPGWAPGDPM